MVWRLLHLLKMYWGQWIDSERVFEAVQVVVLAVVC